MVEIFPNLSSPQLMVFDIVWVTGLKSSRSIFTPCSDVIAAQQLNFLRTDSDKHFNLSSTVVQVSVVTSVLIVFEVTQYIEK